MAYMILFFYGLLTMMTAAAGEHIKPKGGFSLGYLFGTCLSVILWLTVGKNYVGA